MTSDLAADVALERNPQDPRVQRTRAALRTAFNRLISEHGYEAVTPAMIASEAGVGRSTFYDHHFGKDSLLRHSLTPVLQLLADAAVGLENPALGNILRHFWERRRLARELLAGRSGILVRDRLSDLIEQSLRKTGAVGAVPLSMTAVSAAAAQLALVQAWISGRHACTAEQLSIALTRSSHSSADRLLRSLG